MPNTSGQSDPRSILKQTGVEVHPEEFVIISICREDWSTMLQDNSLSPSGNSPFMIFSETNEVTLVLSEADFVSINPALGESRFERGFRLLTFTSVMDFSVVGFLAEVSKVLAAAGIPIVVLSSFSRDHLLIKQNYLADALKALGPFVDSLC